MRKKLFAFVNKLEAINAIIRSKSWFVAVDEPGKDSTAISHSDMPVASLKTISNYTYIKLGVDLDEEYRRQGEANLNYTLQKIQASTDKNEL